MYALARHPGRRHLPGELPVRRPEPVQRHLRRHQGTNGGCGNVLCNAGPGCDGPTGLGTPRRRRRADQRAAGRLAGEVTNSARRRAARRRDRLGDRRLLGHHRRLRRLHLTVPVGSYSRDRAGVRLSSRRRRPASRSPRGAPRQRTSPCTACRAGTCPARSPTAPATPGRSTPRSPSTAYPGGAVYTDPYTGHYSVSLPQQNTYTLHVTPVYPGYTTKNLTVHIGTADKVVNAKVTVDSSTCYGTGLRVQVQAAPPRRSPAGPAPRRRTAGASWTTTATARSGSSQQPGRPHPAAGGDGRLRHRRLRQRTAPATARTPRWCPRWSTCPARPRPRSASTPTTTSSPARPPTSI